ncbi:MAG: hypothetical protein LBU65_00690 [Planctomycetaceae bacterium]|jgi:ribulose-bisphosphate carboxylase large chain|nr:hypothetical protein [Planctomycetaceae bacterium]
MSFKNFNTQHLLAQITGSRFSATYRLTGNEQEARDKAADICTEQTVEFPFQLLPQGAIPDQIVGRIERFEPDGENAFLATITFADETAANESTQLLNVLFGNISIKRGIKLAAFKPSESQTPFLPGAQFGVDAIRKILNVPKRPLLFTALKPMGLSAPNLAELAKLFAEGGIDIIKDDHGLSDQVFSRFKERVTSCANAVNEASVRLNRKSIYVPNITAPFDQLLDRATFAKENGAGAVMISPGLTGLDALRYLTQSKIGLPIIVHPAFIGGMAMSPTEGIGCGVLYGTLMRLLGADATIFPNFGGRFPLSQDDCMQIVKACREPIRIPSIFPSPAGGMELKNIRNMVELYGNDMLILIGSGLFRGSGNLTDNCKRFRDEVDSCLQ